MIGLVYGKPIDAVSKILHPGESLAGSSADGGRIDAVQSMELLSMVSTHFPSARAGRLVCAFSLLTAALLLSGCGMLSYYAQSFHGHISLLQAARPIDDWLSDPATSAKLRTRLLQVRELRTFASSELSLPDNQSYRSYAEIGRPFAVWNVIAAPELSLRPKQWCFPVAGCVPYRGYYSRSDAEEEAQALRREGWDVQVAGVRAYSTLGWTADPLLSTFIDTSEAELARLLFHELSHQLLYVPGDATFNESFATAFEQEGVARWLQRRGDPGLSEAYRLYTRRRNTFVGLLRQHRQTLAQAYATAPTRELARAAKKSAFADLRGDYERAKRDPDNGLFAYAGYDRFFAGELNNAHLAAVATYTQMVPAFVKLLHDHRGDLQKFIAAAKGLAALPKAEREARLIELGAETSPESKIAREPGDKVWTTQAQ